MVVCQTRPTTSSNYLCPLPRFFLLSYLIGIELPKLDSVSICGKSGCFDSMLCNISFHDDNEVFSISKACEVGKINNDIRIRKKNVAKITIINTTAIIKIKIPVVFTLIIFKLASIKVLKRSCVPFTPNSNRRRYYSLSLLPPSVYSIYFTFGWGLLRNS